MSLQIWAPMDNQTTRAKPAMKSTSRRQPPKPFHNDLLQHLMRQRDYAFAGARSAGIALNPPFPTAAAAHADAAIAPGPLATS